MYIKSWVYYEICGTHCVFKTKLLKLGNHIVIKNFLQITYFISETLILIIIKSFFIGFFKLVYFIFLKMHIIDLITLN